MSNSQSPFLKTLSTKFNLGDETSLKLSSAISTVESGLNDVASKFGDTLSQAGEQLEEATGVLEKNIRQSAADLADRYHGNSSDHDD